jgi:hypothetical protein
MRAFAAAAAVAAMIGLSAAGVTFATDQMQARAASIEEPASCTLWNESILERFPAISAVVVEGWTKTVFVKAYNEYPPASNLDPAGVIFLFQDGVDAVGMVMVDAGGCIIATDVIDMESMRKLLSPEV